MSAPVTAGTGIFYTGDMANASGFGTITVVDGGYFSCRLDDGREIKRLSLGQLGHKYEGHCGTRFVTRAAYDAYRAERMGAN